MIQQLTKHQLWLLKKLEKGYILFKTLEIRQDHNFNYIRHYLKDGNMVEQVSDNLVLALLNKGKIKIKGQNSKYLYYEAV